MDDAVALRHLAAGAYHDHHVLTVDGRQVVLRRCTGSQWELAPAAQLAREHATLVALAATGVAPAPLALLADPPLLLEGLVEGRAFSYASDLPALGRSLASVHALAPPHLPELDARAALLEDGGAWLERARAGGEDTEAVTLVAALGAVSGRGRSAPAVLVHTDLNAGNLITAADGQVRLVDWEAARRGPAAWDLAHALSPTTTLWDAASATELGHADVRALLDAYAEAGGSAEAVAGFGELMGAVVFRALAWCLGFRAEVAAGRASAGPELAAALERLTTPAGTAAAVDFARAAAD